MSEQFYAEKMLSYAENSFKFFLSSISAIAVYLAFSKETNLITYCAISVIVFCIISEY